MSFFDAATSGLSDGGEEAEDACVDEADEGFTVPWPVGAGAGAAFAVLEFALLLCADTLVFAAPFFEAVCAAGLAAGFAAALFVAAGFDFDAALVFAAGFVVAFKDTLFADVVLAAGGLVSADAFLDEVDALAFERAVLVASFACCFFIMASFGTLVCGIATLRV